MIDDLAYFRDDLGNEDTVPERHTSPETAGEALARLALDEVLTADSRRRIARATSYALVVEVPSSDWVDAIKEACGHLRPWATIFARTGSSRSEDSPHRGNDKVVQCLARDEGVLGVSQSCDSYLPSSLAGADARIRIRAPSNALIAKVILAVTGRRPRALPPRIAAGLSYWDIAAAIRGTPKASVDRLVAAARSKSVVDLAVADAPPFENLVGYGFSHQWGLRLLRDLESWKREEADFQSIDRNVVLASAPGLGKSTYVRALAKAAKLPLIISSVSSWFTSSNGYLDGVLKQIDTVFDQASHSSPAILFLDEIDSIPNRATLDGRSSSWWTPVCTHILLKLDRVTTDPEINVCVIGATNHPERLDAALVRPGRLNRVIHIVPPCAEDLSGIVRQHLGAELPGLDLGIIGEVGLGATGAEAAGWVKEARARARAAGRPLTLDDLMGVVAPPDTRPDKVLWRAAFHEAGHAVGASVLGIAKVSQVDVIPRGDSGGVTTMEPILSPAPTRDDLERLVLSLLCGRATEIVFLGDACGGSGGGPNSDLARATTVIAGIHGSLGLGSGLAYLGTMDAVAAALPNDPVLRALVETDLSRLQAEAERVVMKYRDAIEDVAKLLVHQRVVPGDVLRTMITEHTRAEERR